MLDGYNIVQNCRDHNVVYSSKVNFLAVDHCQNLPVAPAIPRYTSEISAAIWIFIILSKIFLYTLLYFRIVIQNNLVHADGLLWIRQPLE